MSKDPRVQEREGAEQEYSFAKYTREIHTLISDIEQKTMPLTSPMDVKLEEPQKFDSCGSRLEMELNEIVMRLTSLKNNITL